MGMILQPQLIMMILQRFKDQFGDTLVSKLLWIFRRLMFLARSWFFDLQYYSIKLEELQEALEKWKEYVLDNIQYLPEIFDCDDFAMYFKTWLQSYVMHELDKPFNGVGVVLGAVLKDGQLLGGHAWNLVLVDVSGTTCILFVEPQLGELLSPTLRSSDGYEYVLQAVII